MERNDSLGELIGLVKINTTVAPFIGNSNSLNIVGNGGLILPKGNISQRPTDTEGMLRYNTETSTLEINDGTNWYDIITNSGLSGNVNVALETGTSFPVSPTPNQLFYATSPITIGLDTYPLGLYYYDDPNTAWNSVDPAYVNWSVVDNTPTTLAGYGITDGALDTAVVHLAGTETITGAKTFSSNVIIESTGTTDALRITQTGTGNAFVVEDDTTPDSTAFIINNVGKVIIGSQTATNEAIKIGSNITGGTTAYGVVNYGKIQNDVTNLAVGFFSDIRTDAAFTLAEKRHFQASNTTLFAGSTITNQYGFFVQSNLIQATNNYGFYSNIPDSTNRYNFYAAGTAPNVFNGVTTFGSDVNISGNLTINGTTTTINSTTLTVDDKNIEMGSVTTPTNTTADGGGITLKGATDKTIIWDNANANWTSSENWNLATGKAFKINNVGVLSATTLGSSVVNSSLTSVGTLGSLAVTGAITGASFNSITGLSSTTPLINGTAAVGTSTTTARADHVHPSDTTRAADSSVVHLAGSETITGAKTFTQSTFIKQSNNSPGLYVINTDSTTSRFPTVGATNYTGGNGGYSVLQLANARGTETTPLALQNNDIVGSISARGYNGTSMLDTAWVPIAKINFVATSTLNGTTDNGDIDFYTQAGTTLSKRMKIGSGGFTSFYPDGISSDFYMGSSSNNPAIAFDSGDYIYYDRTANQFNFGIGSTTELSLSSTTATFGGNVNITDNNKLYVGTGNDLYLTHDGTNTSIVNQTGQLNITNSVGNIQLTGPSFSSISIGGEGEVNVTSPSFQYYYTDGVTPSTVFVANNIDITCQVPIIAPSINTQHGAITSATLTTSATTANQVIMSLSATTYRTVEYLIQVKSGTSYHMTKINLIHNGTDVWIDEYGTIYTGTSLATFSADISGGNIRLLLATVANAVTTIKVIATAINI